MRGRWTSWWVGIVAVQLALASCGGGAGEDQVLSSSTPVVTSASTTAPSATDGSDMDGSGDAADGSEAATSAEATVPDEPGADGSETATTPTIGPSAGEGGAPPPTDAPDTTAPRIPSSGPAPWSAAPLVLADLPDVYRLEWAEAGEPSTCPFLALVDLGPEAARAQIRRAESDREMLVAWDNPDGPGHAPSGEPCEDCGRGVVGLGTLQGDYHVTGPATIAWDDGSFANVDVLPWAYGISARIKPAGSNCIYKLWSHISWDHVLYLIGQLRVVET